MLYVNLYIPSIVKWRKKNVQLDQDSYFPKDSTINFTISTKQESQFVLKLLLPSWSKEVDVYVNGKSNISIRLQPHHILN